MLIAIIPVVAAIIGLLLWRPPVPEIGKVLFTCGTLVSLFVAARALLKLP